MSQKYEKLKTLLQELFQLDQPDLDFGLYRVMHAKSAEVSQFLDQDLLPQVHAAFGQYQTADKAEIEKELAKALEQAQALGADPETLPKVKELRARLANDAVDIGALESEVYLADAAEGEHGNVKAAEGKDRRFTLAAGAEAGAVFFEDGELVLSFTYQPNTAKQKELNAAAERAVFAAGDPSLSAWIAELSKPNLRSDGTSSGTRLRVHLDRYTARNTFDYFIHKDLDTFLRRELDFYIKNEVMHLDDVENETAPRVEQYLSKIKVIRKIAGKIIAFLAQLEDFQKKLWLKKKFVVETQWCIRVGCIPEVFYAEIAANEAQHEEWIKLFAINEIKGDLMTPGYSKKLKPEFLRAHPTLVVDTRNFDSGFAARLLEAIGEVDEQTDGVLFHSENFQALSVMPARYREQVK